MKKTETTAELTDTGTSREPHNLGIFDVRSNFKIGIYGWRKRCLYILVLTLLIMVIVNLALTLWVLKVMEFSSEGMGQLKIVSGGLQLEGKAFVLDSLIASSIRSKTGQPIIIESSRNLTLTTRDVKGDIENLIYLGNDRFECRANNFQITDGKGNVLFSANDNEITVGAQVLHVAGIGGTMFKGSVQTPLVRTDSSHGLRLESRTHSLEVRGPSGILLESRAGSIDTLSLGNISLESYEGQIRLLSRSVFMPGLPTVSNATKHFQDKEEDVFQLCMCKDGKLFLAPSKSRCVTNDSGSYTPCPAGP